MKKLSKIIAMVAAMAFAATLLAACGGGSNEAAAPAGEVPGENAADAGVSLPELTAGVCRKSGKLSGLTVNVCRGSATRHTLQLRSG